MRRPALVRIDHEEPQRPSDAAIAAQGLVAGLLRWEEHLVALSRRVDDLERRLREVSQPAVVPLTVHQIVKKYPAFTVGALRWALFHRTTNGLDRAVIQRGRRLLIDEGKFLEWMAAGDGAAKEPCLQDRRARPRTARGRGASAASPAGRRR